MTSKDPFDKTRRMPDGDGQNDKGQNDKGQNEKGQIENGPTAADDGIDRTVPAGERPQPAREGDGEIDATVPSRPQPIEPEATIPTGDQGNAPPPGSDTIADPAAPRNAGDPLIGTELGGCKLEALLGRGAMGAVYRARQVRLNREVAVKVMRPELLSDKRMLERFESEARVVAQFQSPHVVMVHDVGFEHGVHFLVMELVRGKNLREYTRLLAGGRLPVSEALPLLRQACKGLEEAQRQGIIHRDIKPDNLMLTERGELKIADFGIAKPESDDLGLTMTQELIGTPLYMSPEQCQGVRDIDFRSDMYSLGATFYYLLTGEPPVRASSVYELIQTKTRIENLCLWEALPELDEDHPLSRVVARMTALDREDRYDDYEDLASDLLLVQQGRTMEIKRPPSQRRSASPKGGTKTTGMRAAEPAERKGSGLVVALVVILLLGGGGGGYWFWQQQQKSQQDDGNERQAQNAQKATGDSTGDGTASETPEPVAPAVALAGFRDSLRTDGPSVELKAAVADLAAEGEDAAARDALVATIDEGLAIQAALAAIEVPAALALPFDDLEAHLQRVDSAFDLADDADPALRSWAEGALAASRAEAELAKLTGAALTSAFSEWGKRRTAAGKDVAELARLGPQLEAIRTARSRALGLLPGQADAIASRLSREAIATAAADLKLPEPSVDIAARLAELRADFDERGPLDSIRTDVRQLEPVAAADVAARSALLNAIGEASTMKENAGNILGAFPSDPKLPFKDDVEAFFDRIDVVLNPAGKPVAELPAWIGRERSALRRVDTLRPKVVAACDRAWGQWQLARKQRGADPARLEMQLTELRDGLERARRLFPKAQQELDAIVNDRGIAEASASLAEASARAGMLTAVTAIATEVKGIDSLTAWRSGGEALAGRVADLANQLEEAGADAAAQRELGSARDALAEWSAAATRIQVVADHLGAGDLSAALAAVADRFTGTAGRAEFEAFAVATKGCRDAFRGLLEDLDCRAASQRLRAVAEELRRAGDLADASVTRVEGWATAVDRLGAAATGMVAVAAGETRTAGRCEAFFMAPTETTAGKFEEFRAAAAALAEGAGSDREKQHAALAARLGDATPPAAELRAVLRPLGRQSEEMPVQGVSQYGAAACAAWFGLALPTHAEWALAAFGDGQPHDYPWGGREYRPVNRSLMAAGDGGESWRPGGEPRHLAGNVAEWLARTPGSDVGALAGGRYNDVAGDQRRRAAGATHDTALQKGLPGFGFRMVLRPRDHLAPQFAGGQFPKL